MSDQNDTSARPPRHTHGVLGSLSRLRVEYETGGGQDDERPLAGYSLLMSGYTAVTAIAVAVLARRRRGVEVPSAWELVLMAVAVHQLTRTVAKDAVLSPVRAGFTVFAGPAGPGEVMESPRPGPVRHAVGELITCPFCLAQWVATAVMVSWAASPSATRWGTRTMAVISASNVLQHAYSLLEQSSEG